MTELAADGVPVAVTCRVLKLARQPYYRWLRAAVTDTDLTRAYRADALFDARRDDPQFVSVRVKPNKAEVLKQEGSSAFVVGR